MSYLLALDAGTGSVRAVIFDLQGNQIAVGQAEWKHLSVENGLPVHSSGAGACAPERGRYSVRRLLFDARRDRAVRP